MAPGGGGPRAFVDLHCHSSASFDSLTSPATIVRLAAERGLTHQAITDHERLDGALRARDLAPAGLTVIVGEEIRTTGGDIIGLYLTDPVPPGMSPLETAQAIHEQGGLVGLPHPFDRFRGSAGAQAAEEALADLAAGRLRGGVQRPRAVRIGEPPRGGVRARSWAAGRGLLRCTHHLRGGHRVHGARWRDHGRRVAAGRARGPPAGDGPCLPRGAGASARGEARQRSRGNRRMSVSAAGRRRASSRHRRR